MQKQRKGSEHNRRGGIAVEEPVAFYTSKEMQGNFCSRITITKAVQVVKR